MINAKLIFGLKPDILVQVMVYNAMQPFFHSMIFRYIVGHTINMYYFICKLTVKFFFLNTFLFRREIICC